MRWKETYIKYELTKSMEAFNDYCWDESNEKLNLMSSGRNTSKNLPKVVNIRTIWGYLVPFACDRGIGLTLDIQSDVTSPSPKILAMISKHDDEGMMDTGGFYEPEEGMRWCAQRVFEILEAIEKNRGKL